MKFLRQQIAKLQLLVGKTLLKATACKFEIKLNARNTKNKTKNMQDDKADISACKTATFFQCFSYLGLTGTFPYDFGVCFLKLTIAGSMAS